MFGMGYGLLSVVEFEFEDIDGCLDRIAELGD